MAALEEVSELATAEGEAQDVGRARTLYQWALQPDSVTTQLRSWETTVVSPFIPQPKEGMRKEGPWFSPIPLGLVISASRMGRCPGQLLKLLVQGLLESPEEGLLRLTCMVLLVCLQSLESPFTSQTNT